MTQIEPKQAQPPWILSLDIGTSSVRATLFDRHAQTIASFDSRQKYSLEVDIKGAFEIDPDFLIEIVWRVVDEVLQKAGPQAGAIGGVACCTFVSNVMGIDEFGRAVTPLILYGDTRAAPQAEALRAWLDEPVFHQRTGTRFHASYLPARFLWWQQEYPEIFARVRHWISFHEYMLMQLFGTSAVSYSVASWTGLLNRQHLDWDEALLSRLPVDRSIRKTGRQ